MLRSIGRILLVRDQPASPCADSCIIREVGAEEKEEEEEEESEGKSGWTSCYCFSVVRADGSLPLIRGEGDGRRYFRKFFNLACRRTLLLLFYRRTHEDSTSPLSFRSYFFLRCWKNVATTPSSRLRDFQTITFPYMIAFYFLFIYFLFFYRGILLAEHIINWWVNQIVRMHALTPVYNYRN